VVRRDQGNSTRFSCKYHGWQYDEKGALVKAPKFEGMHGFIPQDNGLFEIKLIATNDLIFVNFDPSSLEWTLTGSQAPGCVDNLQWKDSFTIRTELDWKTVGERP
jgi:phenylpropionate dioxygenase-like ring-hydroxylating dioxygenase large terminal subunit